MADVYQRRKIHITPGGPTAGDEIFEGLLANSHFQEKFMDLTPSENKSIHLKIGEYKCLLKKSVFLSYILMNMSVDKVQKCVTVYIHFLAFIEKHKPEFGNNWNRIIDYDNIAFDVIQVFVVK